jgi:hypothetical protein
MGNSLQEGSNALSGTSNAAPAALNAIRTVEVIRQEIARLQTAIARAEKDYWKAVADISKHGAVVTVVVHDKNRKATRKKRPNPALCLQRAAAKGMEEMKERCQELLDEIAAIEKAEKAAQQKDKFAFLDNR